MTGPNKLVIAGAGSGKTTYLVKQALAVASQRVLITTYTESNEEEIRRKFFELHGSVPGHVHIQTWFSLLIEHGIKPFQGKLFEWDVAGMLLDSKRSGLRYKNGQGFPVYWGEDKFQRYYFDRRNRVYSDKLAKLVIRCNKEAAGAVFERFSRIYPFIFVDEVQDLAGYDLDILVALFKTPSHVVLVGDPRQVTYLTIWKPVTRNVGTAVSKTSFAKNCLKRWSAKSTRRALPHRTAIALLSVHCPPNSILEWQRPLHATATIAASRSLMMQGFISSGARTCLATSKRASRCSFDGVRASRSQRLINPHLLSDDPKASVLTASLSIPREK